MWGMSINQTLLGGQNGQSLLGLETSGTWGLHGVGLSSHLALLAMPSAEYCQISSPCKPSGLVVKDLGLSDMFWVVWCVQQATMLLAAASQSAARGACPSWWWLPAAVPPPRQALQCPSPQPPEGHIQTLSAPVLAASAIRHRGGHVFSHQNEWRLVEASSWIRPRAGSGLKFAVTNAAAQELTLWSILCHRGRKKKEYTPPARAFSSPWINAYILIRHQWEFCHRSRAVNGLMARIIMLACIRTASHPSCGFKDLPPASLLVITLTLS